MKLIAIGERRSDNTVVLQGADRREYTFRAEAGGDLVCDIEDDATVELALHSGNFCPAEGEEDAADKLLDGGAKAKPRKPGRPRKVKSEPETAANPDAPAAPGEGEGDGDGDGDGEGD